MHEHVVGNADVGRLLALCREPELPADLSPDDIERIESYSNATLNTYASLAIAHSNNQIDDVANFAVREPRNSLTVQKDTPETAACGRFRA